MVLFLKLGILSIKGCAERGAWVAQWVKRLTLDFSSGHDLTVVRLNLMLDSVLTVGSLLGDSLSPSLSLPLPCSCAFSISLSQNK